MNKFKYTMIVCVVVGLQFTTLYAIYDHDQRTETRAEFAIAARNAIRDQLDEMQRVPSCSLNDRTR